MQSQITLRQITVTLAYCRMASSNVKMRLLVSGCCGSWGRAAVAADWLPRRRYCTVVLKCLACGVARSRQSVGPIVS